MTAIAAEVNFKLFAEPGRRIRCNSFDPFVVDGWEYVTDGAICVRRKSDLPDTMCPHMSGEDYSHPSVKSLKWPCGARGERWKAWPKRPRLFCEVLDPGKVDCHRFMGHECEACEDGHCKRCHKTGGLVNAQPCWICGGNGHLPFAEVCGRLVSNKYLRKVTELLPGPIEYLVNLSEADPLVFRWSDGQGQVMPMREDIKENAIRALTSKESAQARSVPIKVYRQWIEREIVEVSHA